MKKYKKEILFIIQVTLLGLIALLSAYLIN